MITADKIMTDRQLSKFLKTLKIEKEKSLQMIGSGKRKPQDVRNVIDFYLFSLIANTGLRISEALKLKTLDLHEDFLVVRAENSKNGRKGTVYYGPRTYALLKEFIELKDSLLKRVATELLFSLTDRVQSRSYAHTRFKDWLRIAGLPAHFSIHALRHTYGTRCLDMGLSITFVRDNLRHSNISITSQYLHLTKASRDKVRDLF